MLQIWWQQWDDQVVLPLTLVLIINKTIIHLNLSYYYFLNKLWNIVSFYFTALNILVPAVFVVKLLWASFLTLYNDLQLSANSLMVQEPRQAYV